MWTVETKMPGQIIKTRSNTQDEDTAKRAFYSLCNTGPVERDVMLKYNGVIIDIRYGIDTRET